MSLLLSGSDPLGPYAMLAVGAEPHAVKRACMAVEDTHPAARLLDLDVYAADATRIGRADIGEPPCRCLLCEQPAADCIRLGRHPLEALMARVECLFIFIGQRRAPGPSPPSAGGRCGS